jgi:FkbM family methyltransferase
MILPLDYPHGELELYADSETEKTLRVGACKKEPETIAFLESIPKGRVFYDIGANVGSYTLIAAYLKLKVHAFEPVGANYQKLIRNLALNNLNASLHPVLLWSKTGSVGFRLSSDEPGAALHEVSDSAEPWMCWTLDDWIDWQKIPSPQYMKLDVDGAELEVLRGATKALQGVRSLQVEQDATKPENDVKGLLSGLGFTQVKETVHGGGPISNVLWSR